MFVAFAVCFVWDTKPDFPSGRCRSVCCEGKIKSTSKEDADLFYCEEKFKSTSKEYANLFYFEEKFRSTSREAADLFLF